ncbi:MAG: hypothetical protein WEA77_09510 [Hyphomonas sp.]|uniref:hypothetical protein n=1 Tax=Hyphomonas sp. TaxID=87 RepID=UPI0034A01A44
MREQDAYKDLADLFRVEDNALAGEPFTRQVMAGVRRQKLMRRAVVGSLGLAGAAIAAMQLPQLFAEWAVFDRTAAQALTTAPAQLSTAAISQLSAAAMSNPMWLAIAAGAALCIFAVSAFERA